MSALTKTSITAVLGPVGEDLAAQIVSTGASERELSEAKAWFDNDEALHDEKRLAVSPDGCRPWGMAVMTCGARKQGRTTRQK